MTENAAPQGMATPRLSSVIVAATIGNILEWFDFLVYGFFAATLAEVFFPASSSTVSLLITFGTFGLSYVVRPLGAVVIGTYTDRAGRKAGLTLSIAVMMIGTALMAVTPGYAPRQSSSRSRVSFRDSPSGVSSGVPLLFLSSTPVVARVIAQAGSGPARASSRSLFRFLVLP
jgi:MFS family permease